jgi:hypothetical protein
MLRFSMKYNFRYVEWKRVEGDVQRVGGGPGGCGGGAPGQPAPAHQPCRRTGSSLGTTGPPGPGQALFLHCLSSCLLVPYFEAVFWIRLQYAFDENQDPAF